MLRTQPIQRSDDTQCSGWVSRSLFTSWDGARRRRYQYSDDVATVSGAHPPVMRVWQAYRFALDPNNKQRGRLASHAGGARYAYNLGLQWLKTSLANDPRGFRGAVP